MAALDRYNMAVNTTFQARVQAKLFQATVLVLTVGAPTYNAVQIAAAKRVLNRLVPIEAFCLALCNDATFGPLVDSAGGNQATLTDNQIMAGCSATINVFAAGQI